MRWRQVHDQIAHFFLLHYSNPVADDLQCAHCLLEMLLVEIAGVRIRLLDPSGHTLESICCVIIILLFRQAVIIIRQRWVLARLFLVARRLLQLIRV